MSLSEFSKRYIRVMSYIMKVALRDKTDELVRGKISVPQFFTLYFIHNNGAQKMSDLAKEMNVSLPAMSGLVERLYKLNLVRRIYDLKDRRIIRIELTTKGKELVVKILAQREKLISEIFGKIKAKEREGFLKILLKVHNALYKS